MATAFFKFVYVLKLVPVEVSKTSTNKVFVSIVISGITYICLSSVSPTKNVLVLSSPSNIVRILEPVEV